MAYVHRAEDAQAVLAAHRKLCGPCSKAKREDRTALLCDEGWQLAQAVTRTQLEQAVAEEVYGKATAAQGELV
jgi:hypothetical protein